MFLGTDFDRAANAPWYVPVMGSEAEEDWEAEEENGA